MTLKGFQAVCACGWRSGRFWYADSADCAMSFHEHGGCGRAKRIIVTDKER